MKVGDYVRLSDGIHKIKHYEYRPDYENCHCMYLDDNDYGLLFTNKDLIKLSPNIIDLIEVGDYVNGKRVEWIGYDLYRENEDKTLTGIGEKRILFNEFTKDSVREKGIMTIVTKEQFESMEYKVGE